MWSSSDEDEDMGVGGASPKPAAKDVLSPLFLTPSVHVMVVVDGANVGWTRGLNEEFEPSGIVATLAYYKSRHIPAFAFVPAYYVRGKPRSSHHPHRGNSVMETERVEELQALVQRGDVVLTPPHTDDDKFIITYAADHNGFVVTNDMFRDHIAEQPTQQAMTAARAWVKARTIPYTFVRHEFVPDPPQTRVLLSAIAITPSAPQTKPPPPHPVSTTAASAPAAAASSAAAPSALAFVEVATHPPHAQPAARITAAVAVATQHAPASQPTPASAAVNAVAAAPLAGGAAAPATDGAKDDREGSAGIERARGAAEATLEEPVTSVDVARRIKASVRRLVPSVAAACHLDHASTAALVDIVAEEFVTRHHEYSCVHPRAPFSSWMTQDVEVAIARELSIISATLTSQAADASVPPRIRSDSSSSSSSSI